MKEKYTVDNILSHATTFDFTPITANGQFSTVCNRWDINYSEALSYLIRECGRLCDSYSSDLFISWESIVRDMTEYGQEYNGGIYLFGIRKNGVDGNGFTISRLNNTAIYGKEYRDIYALEIFVEHGETYWDSTTMTMTLHKIDIC